MEDDDRYLSLGGTDGPANTRRSEWAVGGVDRLLHCTHSLIAGVVSFFGFIHPSSGARWLTSSPSRLSGNGDRRQADTISTNELRSLLPLPTGY